MHDLEFEELFSLPPEALFDFVIRPENLPRIFPSVVRLEPAGGGPLAPGQRCREVRTHKNETVEAELQVVEVEPCRSFAFGTQFAKHRFDWRFELEPEAEGTRVRLTCDVQAEGLLSVMAPILVADLKESEGNPLQSLRLALRSPAG